MFNYHQHFLIRLFLWSTLIVNVLLYDPEDKNIVLPREAGFEAFYPREAYGVAGGSSRAAHGHGTFYKNRHSSLIDVPNSAAYGFRFDGHRRFSFD